MALENNVFHLFLKGDAQVLGASEGATATWNGETSLVWVDGIDENITTFTVGDAELPGTMLIIRNVQGSYTVKVVTTTDFYVDDDNEDYTLGADNQDVSLMWTGEGWVLLGTGSAVASS
jgi:hypothetical protein